MAKAHIDSGICGFTNYVKASRDKGYQVKLEIESECPDIQNFAEDDELKKVNAVNEISHRRGKPTIISKGKEYCAHASCPMPAGVVKVVEVEAGLSLPLW